MKHKGGLMQVRRLPDLRRSNGISTLLVLPGQEVNNSTTVQHRNTTISTRMITVTVMMMVMAATVMTRDTASNTTT
jgi:hypothetical protein